MKVWTDKQGNKLTGKEFIERWKDGIQKVTPLQQIKISLFSFLPVIAGILWGLMVTALNKTWWMFLILIGSLFLTSVAMFGNYQKYLLFKKIEKEVNKNV